MRRNLRGRESSRSFFKALFEGEALTAPCRVTDPHIKFGISLWWGYDKMFSVKFNVIMICGS